VFTIGGDFLNNFQKLRKKANLTQEELATVLKVDRSAVAKWESSVSLPRTELLPKLADIFDCKIDDLFENSQSG
jgi:transcriptional regulator with XRE-family HTH domain